MMTQASGAGAHNPVAANPSVLEQRTDVSELLMQIRVR